MSNLIVITVTPAAPPLPVVVVSAQIAGQLSLFPVPDFCYEGILAAYLPRPTMVTLPRYCQILAIPERPFWGIQDPTIEREEAYWDGEERRQLAEAILAAEGMVESELGVPLGPKWSYREQRPTRFPLLLEWGEFLCPGLQVAELYENHSGVAYLGSQGIVTVPHGGIGSEAEVAVFVYDADAPTRLYRTVIPSDIDWEPGSIVITIPKWRLLRPELGQTSYDVPINLTDDTNFVDYVLVARHYTDPSEQIRFVGSTSQELGFMQCDNAPISKVRPEAGFFDGAYWHFRFGPCVVPRYIEASYRAGIMCLPYDLEQAVIRLAHSLLPEPVCPATMEPWVRYWNRDRNVPASLTRERVNCPWGQSDGAWFAWNVVQRSPFNIRKGGAIWD